MSVSHAVYFIRNCLHCCRNTCVELDGAGGFWASVSFSVRLAFVYYPRILDTGNYIQGDT